ncbi:nucleotide exchange factor GrpE [Allorhodopirellula solitaria]|uniref:Protein GrpE n=1 Tax=Allorhodopirellula solitaria TaxID=2527987 RepID=A0A5C5XUZ9_9BACT|nr:nucleotide exchange factor GrpE [Allorhodopirellula solitaria]TWT67107.1 Protein GrpE [Allorhodopirellula solitaria]
MNAPPGNASGDSTTEDIPPTFGLLDVVEAFTAMRHEYRNQTKETRAVAERLGSTSEKLDAVGERIEAVVAATQNKASTSRSGDDPSTTDENLGSVFALRLAEIDHAVSRSIDAARRSLCTNPDTAPARAPVSATDYLGSLGPITRFFCRRFAHQLDQQRQHEAQPKLGTEQATIENVVAGLAMTTDHVRRELKKHGVERIDVLGQPFDGEAMHAVEVVDSDAIPPGHVAEQLSPAYRFGERIIRYADVRIARG